MIGIPVLIPILKPGAILVSEGRQGTESFCAARLESKTISYHYRFQGSAVDFWYDCYHLNLTFGTSLINAEDINPEIAISNKVLEVLLKEISFRL
jgi:hypothetical protein